jgi:hypothetical protein
MKQRIPKVLKIIMEVLVLAGIVLLFIFLLDPEQLRSYLQRITLGSLLGLMAFAIGITLLMRLVFYTGLRRYESGSAINVNV